jgi:6-phosphogluconate dehydrogenase
LAGIDIGGAARGIITAVQNTISPNTDNGPRGDFGLIGLAVMGQNLILNAADHGFNVIAFNRTVSKVDHFLANEAKGKFVAQRQFGRLANNLM